MFEFNEENCFRCIGDVVIEPKMCFTKTGREYKRFVINITEYQNDKAYQNAFPIHSFGTYADNLKVTDKVLIVGRLRNKRWLNENGNTSYYVYVLAEFIKVMKDNRQINLYNDKELYDLINDFNENWNEL